MAQLFRPGANTLVRLALLALLGGPALLLIVGGAVAAATGLCWLAFLYIFTFADYFTR